jgi:hypothetical protein
VLGWQQAIRRCQTFGNVKSEPKAESFLSMLLKDTVSCWDYVASVVEEWTWRNGRMILKRKIPRLSAILFYHTFHMDESGINPGLKRLRWSWGSVLPLSTHVRGFKPGRSL